MGLSITPLHPVFAAAVGGVDLREPIDAATLRALTLAADQYAVLVFPGQGISDAQQIAFSAQFGELETTIKAYRPCLLYTSDAADDLLCVDLGGRRIIK